MRRTFSFGRTSCIGGAWRPGTGKSIWVAPAVVLAALSPAFLGGDGSDYGEAIPLIGIGLLFWFRPLRAIPKGALLIGIIGLVVCGLMGFLPARWLGEPGWHSAIRHAIPGLARTVTLQPLHSLERFSVMLCAILFGVWVLQWRENRRVWGISVLCSGVALVAAVAIAVHFLSISLPGWHPSQGFGSFPNRNQTATLMGLGALLASGFCVTSARCREWSGIFWSGPFALCLTALLLTNSRTPLCLLAAGIFLLLLLRQRSVWEKLAVAGGAVLLVCSATLLIGGSMANRFPELWAHGLGFRSEIYQDTLRLASKSPVTGIGVGNFEAIFPQFRQVSLNDERVVHPESDWLWMASELGWISIIFCGLAVAGVLSQRARIRSRRENGLRQVSLIAIGAFMINTIVDVPGHRLGTVLPILVLASLCAQPGLMCEGSKILFWVSRFISVGIAALAVILVQDAAIEKRIQSTVAGSDWSNAQSAISEGLMCAPLRWSLYTARGYADVHQRRWLEAITDFHYADFLEPKLALVPLGEGMAWAGVNRTLAIAAWREALRRSKPGESGVLYNQMLSASLQDPQLHLATIRLADRSPSLAILALDLTNVDPRTLEILESERSGLTPDQVLTLTRAEAAKAAIDQNFQEAYVIAVRVMRPIVFPKRSQRPEPLCRVALSLNPRDYAAAFDLCSILEDTHRWDEALKILEPLTQSPNCPDYFLVMEAEAYAGANQWSDAWAVAGGLMR